MALQLIYTSSPRLVEAGRSGFGTVARSKSLPPLATNAIERLSKYANLRGNDRSRTVMAHRKITVGSSRLNVLSRIQDAGSDHTGRTNHIAHHLVLSPLEVREAISKKLTPADVLDQFDWLSSWDQPPKLFTKSEDVSLSSLNPSYATSERSAWGEVTGQPLHARLLVSSAAPKSGVLIIPKTLPLIPLLGEALAESANPWDTTFTTYLEPTDELSELDWIIVDGPTSQKMDRLSARQVFDLSHPEGLPVPEEKKSNKTPQRKTPPPTGISLQSQPSRERGPSRSIETGSPINQSPQSAGVGRDQVRKSVPEGNSRNGEKRLNRYLIIGVSAAAAILMLVAIILLKPGGDERKESGVSDNKDAVISDEEISDRQKKLEKVGVDPSIAENIAKSTVYYPELADEIKSLKSEIKGLEGDKFFENHEAFQIELDKFNPSPRLMSSGAEFPKDRFPRTLIEIASFIKLIGQEQKDIPRSDEKAKIQLLCNLKEGLDKLDSTSASDSDALHPLVKNLWKWSYKTYLELYCKTEEGGDEQLLKILIDFTKPDLKRVENGNLFEALSSTGKGLFSKEVRESKDIEHLIKKAEPRLQASDKIDESQVNQILLVPESPKIPSSVTAGNSSKPKKEKKSEIPKLENEEFYLINYSEFDKKLSLPEESKIVRRLIDKLEKEIDTGSELDCKLLLDGKIFPLFNNIFNSKDKVNLKKEELELEWGEGVKPPTKRVEIRCDGATLELKLGKESLWNGIAPQDMVASVGLGNNDVTLVTSDIFEIVAKRLSKIIPREHYVGKVSLEGSPRHAITFGMDAKKQLRVNGQLREELKKGEITEDVAKGLRSIYKATMKKADELAQAKGLEKVPKTNEGTINDIKKRNAGKRGEAHQDAWKITKLMISNFKSGEPFKSDKDRKSAIKYVQNLFLVEAKESRNFLSLNAFRQITFTEDDRGQKTGNGRDASGTEKEKAIGFIFKTAKGKPGNSPRLPKGVTLSIKKQGKKEPIVSWKLDVKPINQ
ncbi:hypothetical protein N9050_03100 [Akkermansiaceae bacterium]|nr:hypothetical protein [Akkermansiaceae bacterium]